jgi:hypothetical protein
MMIDLHVNFWVADVKKGLAAEIHTELAECKLLSKHYTIHSFSEGLTALDEIRKP